MQVELLTIADAGYAVLLLRDEVLTLLTERGGSWVRHDAAR